MQREQEAIELRAQISTLRSEHDSALALSRQKDERIQQLMREVQNLEERCTEAEQSKYCIYIIFELGLTLKVVKIK